MAALVKLLLGTKKGGFIYTSDEKRQRWQISEPILPGWTFYHMAADTRSDQPRPRAGRGAGGVADDGPGGRGHRREGDAGGGERARSRVRRSAARRPLPQ